MLFLFTTYIYIYIHIPTYECDLPLLHIQSHIPLHFIKSHMTNIPHRPKKREA